MVQTVLPDALSQLIDNLLQLGQLCTAIGAVDEALLYYSKAYSYASSHHVFNKAWQALMAQLALEIKTHRWSDCDESITRASTLLSTLGATGPIPQALLDLRLAERSLASGDITAALSHLNNIAGVEAHITNSLTTLPPSDRALLDALYVRAQAFRAQASPLSLSASQRNLLQHARGADMAAKFQLVLAWAAANGMNEGVGAVRTSVAGDNDDSAMSTSRGSSSAVSATGIPASTSTREESAACVAPRIAAVAMEDLLVMKVTELRARLDALSLNSKGLKQALVDRLWQALAAQACQPTPPPASTSAPSTRTAAPPALTSSASSSSSSTSSSAIAPSAVASPDDAIRALHAAYDLAQKSSCPIVYRDICMALVEASRHDPLLALRYLHNALGISACRDACALRGERAAGER